MTNDTRRPGPWDTLPEGQPQPPAPTEPDQALAEPPLQGQHPAMAIGGTLLFAGFIWYLTQSWIIAVALIFGLFVHEYGHVLAMNRLGMGPARIYIIPFLGGAAAGQRAPKSVWDGVIVALAGPLFGLLATIPAFGLFLLLGDPMWLLAAFVICMINLVNLAPAPPLDGSKAIGPLLARIHPWVEQGVMLAIGAVVIVWALTRESYIFGGFLALALFGHLRRGPTAPPGRPLSNREAVQSLGLYLMTAGACVAVAAVAPTILAGDPMVGLDMIGQYFGLWQ
jgi:Zn-dependent protease